MEGLTQEELEDFLALYIANNTFIDENSKTLDVSHSVYNATEIAGQQNTDIAYVLACHGYMLYPENGTWRIITQDKFKEYLRTLVTSHHPKKGKK